tara:strand:+ start:1740 stop:2327 length:588 start_codon:yes stop_codon:yes gene_type:complete
MTVIWDLCSGLGGWSEAFVQAGHTVIRIDNNDLVQYVPHTLKLDVTEWEEWHDDLPRPDIILASPPCLEFSNGYNAPRPKARREGREFHPDMSILAACKAIIDYYAPQWWIIENVAGASKDFSEFLGMPPRQIVGSALLWGYFPYIDLDSTDMKKTENFDVGNPLRANIRAKIPFELSFQCLKACQDQKSLMEWS